MMRSLKAGAFGLALFCFAAGGLTAPAPASAQTVFCVNCAQWSQQLLQYAQEAQTALSTAKQLQQQISMYQNMVQNTANLPNQIYGNIASDLNGVTSSLNQVKGIAYNASDLDSTFAQHFPGYSSYAAQSSPTSMAQKYQQWSSDVNSSTQAVFDGVAAQNQKFGSETALLNSLQGQNLSATGHMQAAQIANELAAQQVGQIQKLRQLVMLQVQMQGTYLQTAADQDAQLNANGQRNAQAAGLNNTGNPRY